MEHLQRLTRRRLRVLQAVRQLPGGPRGVALNAVARALRIRAPSALAHVRTLELLGLVNRTAGKTRLTHDGVVCLEEYRRHHRIAESLFSQLHLPPKDACRAAKEIDLALSHRTVERLCAAEGHPAVCPHGEPIAPCGPGSGREGK